MATIWITYAWSDNIGGDVDFIAQELGRAGITVKLDRWNIGAGRRLWQQIENFICAEDQSNAWLLVATSNSLESEACKEEFAYALDRALKSRGEGFPVIGLFCGPVDQALLPAGIRTRLYVSITDPDWKERIVAAAEGRLHQVLHPEIRPFHDHVYYDQPGDRPFVIEVRPRAGVWSPFFVAIPSEEKDVVDPHIMIGPRDRPTRTGMLVNFQEGQSQNGTMWMITAGNQSTPTESYYVWCKRLPTRLVFGVIGGPPQYSMTFAEK